MSTLIDAQICFTEVKAVDGVLLICDPRCGEVLARVEDGKPINILDIIAAGKHECPKVNNLLSDLLEYNRTHNRSVVVAYEGDPIAVVPQ